jgi:MFS family permease
VALAQVLAMTLWFSATAVAPSLQAAMSLDAGAGAWLTTAVQLGFVAGALGAAFANLPDLLPPRRLVAAGALVGAAANAALALSTPSFGTALALRFATGMSLACVYPPAMKVIAGHVTGRHRGLAIGLLVGAITVGSATPHLVAGWFERSALPHAPVLSVSSGLAVLAAALMQWLVVDGPHAPPRARFDPRQVGRTLHDRAVRLAILAYCGHMWELYAMWTWLVTFVGQAAPGLSQGTTRLLTFTTIGIAGALGAVLGGFCADRVGRTRVTVVAMAISATCCATSPLLFGAPTAAWFAFGLVWGASAVADSAQFSAAVTELAQPGYIGTAVTLQTSLGFLLTMVTIQGLPLLAERIGWQYAFVVLAPGPALGCIAMLRLGALPAAARMAGGRR